MTPILTLLFLYKQLLKSCHAVSQTQGRTEILISKILPSAQLRSYSLLWWFTSAWPAKIARVQIEKFDYLMLGFLMYNSNWNAQRLERIISDGILASFPVADSRNLMLMKTYLQSLEEVIYSGSFGSITAETGSQSQIFLQTLIWLPLIFKVPSKSWLVVFSNRELWSACKHIIQHHCTKRFVMLSVRTSLPENLITPYTYCNYIIYHSTE